MFTLSTVPSQMKYSLAHMYSIEWRGRVSKLNPNTGGYNRIDVFREIYVETNIQILTI